jgi:hypothetical protein
MRDSLEHYVEQFQDDNGSDEDKYNCFFQDSFGSVVEGSDISTLFILELIMKRLGFIDANTYPEVSSYHKDIFNKSYTVYDILFVIVFLYFGLCKGFVISLPQLRTERLSKRARTDDSLQQMKELREIATSKLVTATHIRTLWKTLEPRLLQHQWNFCRMFRRKSLKEGEEGKKELLTFTRTRKEFFAKYQRKEATQVKDMDVKKTSLNAVIALREKLQAYQRGDDDDMSDSESDSGSECEH